MLCWLWYFCTLLICWVRFLAAESNVTCKYASNFNSESYPMIQTFRILVCVHSQTWLLVQCWIIFILLCNFCVWGTYVKAISALGKWWNPWLSIVFCKFGNDYLHNLGSCAGHASAAAHHLIRYRSGKSLCLLELRWKSKQSWYWIDLCDTHMVGRVLPVQRIL
jgi:hypothetical protein